MASVRLFAALRELAGTSTVDVHGDSVQDLVGALSEKYGSRFGEIARAGTVVVDGERASFDRRLEGTEEVALLPPVSGGSGRPRPQRVLLVVNPVARTVSRAKLDVIEKALAADFKLDVDETTGRGHAMELARAAAADGYDLVVVFSGDGTLNEAINGLAGTDAGLGIIPGGATNVLARVLGIPEDPVEATGLLIGWALEGRGRLVPVGNAGGRRFAFACGIGLDALAMARVDEAKAPSKQAYERAALSAVLRSALLSYAGRDPDLTVRVDGGEPVEAISVLIGRSNPYTYYKRWGIKVTPQASLDGGLDVLTARRLARRSALRLIVQLFGSGKHVKRRDMDYVHDATEVEIEGSSPFPLQVDGDYLGTRERLTVTVERDALWIVG
ncbi:MAG: MoaD/ThiS family protein [Actinomycetota bacterium]|nr:MoaD/ThiS family protein [Actinomycetota bacterium]